MVTLRHVADTALVRLNEATDRTFALPVLILFPTARCNSRCVSCDCWRADGAGDLTLDELRRLADELPALGTRHVTFSGGEATLRRDVYEIAAMFRARHVTLHLLTSGLFLERDAAQIAEHFERVTLSLDAHTATLYEQIRGVNGLGVIERGVRKLRALSPRTPVRARSTLHRYNFTELPALIDKAHALGLDGISFLTADVTSDAFGRGTEGGGPRHLLLTPEEVEQFAQVVEETIASHADDIASGFVAESPLRLRSFPAYYRAQLGLGEFPPLRCNAPWASAVIEADGAVRPCFFHPAVGNIRRTSLKDILANEMVTFRRGLQIADDPICRRCVCSFLFSLRTTL